MRCTLTKVMSIESEWLLEARNLMHFKISYYQQWVFLTQKSISTEWFLMITRVQNFELQASKINNAHLSIHESASPLHAKQYFWWGWTNTWILCSNSYAILEICKGMYSLKEAAILAYEKLRENPAKYGFVPFKHNAEIWRHVNQAITFYLAVDNLD